MVRRTGESGNIFFTLFGAVAMVGLIGVATSALLRGPVGTVVAINQKSKADSQIQIASKLALIEAAQQADGGDCDGDQVVEPLPWRDPGGGSAPTNAGWMPMSIGAAKVDPWGTDYGYCVWDMGVVDNDPGCDAVDGANSNSRRLSGGSRTDYPVLAIVSAGPDRTFQVGCNDWADNVPSNVDPNVATSIIYNPQPNDDILVAFTYDEAISASQGLWALKSNDPDTLETGRGIEVGGSASFQSSANFVGDTAFGGFADFGGGGRLDLMADNSLFLLPTQTSVGSTDTDCNGANQGAMRRNTSSGSEILEICEGGVWVEVGTNATNAVAEINDLDDGQTGGGNVFLGTDDGSMSFDSATALSNTGLGAGALNSLTSGDNNTAFGAGAGSTITTGSDNILIGQGVGSGLAAGTSGYLSVGNIFYSSNYGAAASINAGAIDLLGNTDVTGTLDVSGAISGDSLGVTNGITGDFLTVTNTVTGGALSITNNGTIGGNLYVNGGVADIDADLIVTGNLYDDSGNLTINDATDIIGNTDITGTLATSGQATLNSLSVTNNATIGGTLGVTGATTLSGTLGVTDVASFGDRIGVGDAVTGSGTASGTACATPGEIQYDIENNYLMVCTGGSWEVIGTSGGGGSGIGGWWDQVLLGVDERIYYIDGFVGVGTNDPLDSLHVSSGGLLVESPHTGTASVPTSGAGTRMMFHTQMSAFRAGAVTGTDWDDANIGAYSMVMGRDARAAATDSLAFGRDVAVTNTGTNSMGVGLGVAGGVSPLVAGAGSLGVFSGDQAGLNFNTANTVGFFGSKIVLDPREAGTVGAGAMEIAADGTLTLDVEGGVGATNYCDEDGNNCFTALSVSSGAAPGNDREILYNSGGVMGTDPNFVFASTGYLGIGTSTPEADVDIARTGSILMPRGTTGQRPSSAVNGMFRYNADNDRFEGRQGGAWRDVLTDAALAAGLQGEIQYNSGGELGATSSFFWDNIKNGLALGSSTVTGTLTLDVTGDVGAVQYCDDAGNDCFTAADVTGGALGAPGNNREMIFNDGGFLGTDTNLVFTSTGEFGIGTNAPSSTLDVIGTLGVSGVSTFGGTVNFASGGGAAPSLTFTGDTDTGLYNPAADQIGISTGGTEKIRITASGALVIGDTSNSSGEQTLELDVTGDVGAQNYCNDLGNDCFTANDIVSGSLGAPGSDREILYNSNGQLDTDTNFVYTSSGRFGVGTSTPQAFADFNSVEAILLPRGLSGQRPGGVNGMFRYNTDNDRFEGFQGGKWYDILTEGALAAGSDRQLQFNSGGELGAMTNLVYTSTGLLGVGTAAPTQTVDIDGTLNATGAVTFASALGVTGAADFAEDVRLKDGLVTDPSLTFTNDQNTGLFSAAADELGFTVAGSEAMRLDSAGNLLVGTATVSGTLLADIEGDLGAVQFCDENGANCFTAASVSSGSSPAPGNPTEVVYNSGGVLWADTNFVYTADGDFIVGSYQLDDTTTGSEDNRVFFDRSKGAFRAGGASGTQWDAASVGAGSIGLGIDTIASGDNAAAIGQETTASNLNSIAIGTRADASGDSSIAFGSDVTAGGLGGSFAFGTDVTASGTGSFAFGTDGSPSGVKPEVSGGNSFGIFLDDQSGVDMTAANTMGLFGGSMVIDPAVPATNLSADTALEVEGTVKIAYGGEACDAAREGAVRFSSTGNVFAVCADNLNGWEDIKLGPDTLADLDDTNLTGPATGDVLYYSGSEWVNAQLPASSIIAPGSDRQVTFNSGGNFATDTNFVYTSAGDFIIGSYQLDDTTTGSEDNRMFFDRSKGAFRSGVVPGGQWDAANVGDHSVAMGYETTSSGDASVAIGYQTTASADGALASGYQSLASGTTSFSHGWSTVASGNYGVALGYNADATGANSTAIGDYAIASGLNAMAFGNVVQAGDGTAGSGAGDYSVAFGLGNNSALNIPQVSGVSSFGIFMGDQSNVDLATANTMGLFGGSMVIDLATPATNLSPDTALEVEGTVKVAYGGEACDAAREGAVRFSSTGNVFAVCADNLNGWEDIKLGPDTLADLDDTNLTGPATGDVLYYSGSEWVNAALPSSSVAAAGSDRQIQFNSGNAFAADTNFVYTADGDFVVGSYQIEDTTTGNEDNRMFFDVSTGAFRAGTATGAEWNYASAGSNSVAFGYNTVASGLNSFAMGEQTTSSGWASAAFGANNTASGSQSNVFGYTSVASGSMSFAAGWSVGALGDRTFAAGQDVDAVGQNSFAFGLGNSNNSNLPQVSGAESFGVFMGVQDGADLATANTMGLFGGRMVIDPAAPATVFAPATGGEQNLEFHVEGDIGGVNYCDNAGNDCFTAGDVASLASGSVPAPGSDRQVIYNSGGSFDADTNFVYTSAGDFIVGSYQIEDTGTGSEDNRMFFDVSNSAFRAGSVSGNQWDYASSGQYSAAFGSGTVASASYSMAWGWNTVASGSYGTAWGVNSEASGGASTAFGYYTTASGTRSLATGWNTTASGYLGMAMGREVKASGQHTVAIGLSDQSNIDADRPQVSGDGAMGIFMNSYDNYNLSDTDTFAVIGGKIMIDGDGNDTAGEGCLRYDDASDKLQFSHDCTTYSDLGAVQGAAGSDRQIQFNSGNAFAADANFVYTSAGRVGIGVSSPDKPLHVAGGARFEVDGATKYVALGTPNAVPGITIENAGLNTKFERTASYFVMGNKSPPNALYIFDTTDNVAMGGQSNGNTTQLYVDGTIKMAYGGEACDAAREGAVHYDSGGNTFYFCADSGLGWEAVSLGTGTLAGLSDTNISGPATGDVLYYSGSEWVNAELPASSIIAPGSDRQVTFNSAGDFATDANFVYTSAGDFIVGSYQLDDTGTGSEDNRMFFDRSRAAFRAGNANGSQWDSVNVGSGSVAMGDGPTASGASSIAIGNNVSSTNTSTIAIGRNASASGQRSMAFGSNIAVSGQSSVGYSLGIHSPSYPEVSSNNSFGIFMGDQSGVDLSSANTMGLFGGKMVIDPAVPATNLSADTALDVEGTVKISYGGEACDAAREGAIHYDSATKIMNMCDGTSWLAVNTGAGGLWTDNTTHISYSSLHIIKPGETMTSAGFDSADMDGLVFHNDKYALRFGRNDFSAWNEANIGASSFAGGEYAIASGSVSFAFGRYLDVTGDGSVGFARSNDTIVSGAESFAFGNNLNINGIGNYAWGEDLDVAGGTVDTMSFSLGSGATTEPSLTANADRTFNVLLGTQDAVILDTPDQISFLGGNMVIDPSDPGANLVADTALEVEGTVKIAYGGEACDTAREGAIRFDSGANTFSFCADDLNGWEGITLGSGTLAALGDTNISGPATGDVLYYSGSEWVNAELPASSIIAPGSDRQLIFNSAGDFAADANFVYTSAGYLGVGTSSPNVPLEVAGNGDFPLFILNDTVGGSQDDVSFWNTGSMFRIRNYTNDTDLLTMNINNGITTLSGGTGELRIIGTSGDLKLTDTDEFSDSNDYIALEASGDAGFVINLYDDSAATTYDLIKLTSAGDMALGVASPDTKLDVDGTVKISYGGEACDAAREGAIHYDSATKIMNMCDGASWLAVNTGAGGLWTDNTTHISYSSLHILNPGETMTTAGFDGGSTGFVFHNDKRGLRIGSTNNTDWDEGNIGTNSLVVGGNSMATGSGSVAFGNSSNATGDEAFALAGATASGGGSFAMGYSVEATASGSFAIGDNSTASGANSITIGHDTIAAGWRSIAFGSEVNVTGSHSMGYGLATGVATDPIVSGDNSFGLFLGNQSGVDFASSQTFGVFGGEIMIDYSSATAGRGCIRYDESGNKLQFSHDCATYSDLGGAGNAAGSDRQIQFNSANAFAADANFIYTADGDVLLSGTHTGTASVPASGAGTRMFFDTQTSAFRAGGVNGSDWDNAQIGIYSAAMGYNTEATGPYSFAVGGSTIASGNASIASGNGSTASGDYSVALGWSALASGNRSVALGDNPTASATGSLALGRNTTANADYSTATGSTTTASGIGSTAMGVETTASGSRSVALGQRATASSNYSFAFGLGNPAILSQPEVNGVSSFGIFMGAQDSVNLSSSNTMGLFGGKMVIDPAVPATNLSADTALEVEGTVKIAYGGEACDAAREGAIRFDSGANTFSFCANDASGWESITLGSGTLAALSDTNISVPATGNVLYYSGSEWVNANLTVSDLADVDTTGFADGHVLTYSAGASGWVSAASAGGGTFTDLSDTPSSYGTQGGKFARVNSGETALEFTDQIIDQVAGNAPTGMALDDLSDVNAGAPSTNEVLTWDGSEWIASAVSGSDGGKWSDGLGTDDIIYNSGAAPKVGIGLTTPAVTLDVDGLFKLADSGETCGASLAGSMRYKDNSLWYCNGTSWNTLADGSTTEGSTAATLVAHGAETVNATSFALDPTALGASIGDMMIVSAVWEADSTVTPPAGWTTVYDDSNPANGVTGRLTVHTQIFSGSVPGSQSWSYAGGNGVAYGWSILSGASGVVGVFTHQYPTAGLGTASFNISAGPEGAVVYTLADSFSQPGETATYDTGVAAATNDATPVNGRAALAGFATTLGTVSYTTTAIDRDSFASVWLELGDPADTPDVAAAGVHGAIQLNSGGSLGAKDLVYTDTERLGIGTTAPTAPFHFKTSENPTRLLLHGTGGGNSIEIAMQAGGGSPGFRLGRLAGNDFQIDSADKIELLDPVGINGGYTDPANSLDVSGAASIGTNYYATVAPTDGLIVEGLTGIGTTSPQTKLDVVGTMRAIDDAAGCTAAVRGALRYNSAGGAMEVCDGSTWGSLASGGGLWTDNTTHISYESTHILKVGQTLPATIDDDGIRMFFYPDKGAFRGGEITGGNTAWQDGNIGSDSFAWGTNVKVSASNAAAFGTNMTVSGIRGFATGLWSVAGGDDSFATGELVSALGSGSFAAGFDTMAQGANSIAIGRRVDVPSGANYSMAIGLGDASGTYPQVTATQSLGIFMGDQSGVDLSSANVMGLFGGEIMIDYSSATAGRGCIRYDEGTSKLQFSHDCATYSDLGAGGGALNDLSDVDTTGFATGEVLTYSAGASGWVSAPVSGAIWSDEGSNIGYSNSYGGARIGAVSGAASPVGATAGLGSGGGSAAGTDREIQFNNAGSLGANTNFVYTAAGNMGIGLSNPGHALTISSTIPALALVDSDSFTDATDRVLVRAKDDNFMLEWFNGGPDTTSEWLTVDANGMYLRGTNRDFTIESTSGAASVGPDFFFVRSNGGGLVADGTEGGEVEFFFEDGSGTPIKTAGIGTQVNGTTGLGSVPTDMEFTTGDGSTAPAIRMLIDSSGLVSFTSTGAIVLPVGADSQRPSPAQAGMIRFSSTSNSFEGYDGSTWGSLASGGSGTPDAPDRGIQFNSGGSFAAESNFTYTADGDLIVGSSQIEDTGTGSEDSRMFFDVSNSAFRAGFADGNQWNYASSGQYSTAFGKNSIASGYLSMAMGNITKATGSISTAMGTATTASGNYSTAMGQSTTASGDRSTAMGGETTASGGRSTSMGWRTVASGANGVATGLLSVASGATSTAMGWSGAAGGLASAVIGTDTIATGDYSIALGRNVIAGDGQFTGGDEEQGALNRDVGEGAMAIGLTTAANAPATDPMVTGDQSLGIFMGNQSGYNLSDANVMALVGGELMIDYSSAGSRGCIRYDEGTSKLQYSHDCTSYTDLGGAANAAGSDRQIQFNSANAFAADANFVYTSAGDLIVGSSQIEDTGTGTEDSRMFFDVSNSAFRAGFADGNQWNYASSGQYSTAFGGNTIASGNYSTAMGYGATASSGYSVAFGYNTVASNTASVAMGLGPVASGLFSTAMGRYTNASGAESTAIGNGADAGGMNSVAMGNDAAATGDRSTVLGSDVIAGDGQFTGGDETQGSLNRGVGEGAMAIGLITSANSPATRPMVTGDESLGIFMGNQSGYNLSDTNTMALIGGKFMVDDDGTAGSQGCIRYDGGTSKLQYSHDCTSYTDLGGAANAAGSDRQIQFNSGGSFAAEANFTYTADGDFIVGSSQIEDTGTGTEDSRMFFDVSNSAFRAGGVDGNQWNFSSAGQYSTAFGYNTTASGYGSTAMGEGTTAGYGYSTAMGFFTTASHNYTTAMGYFTTASGQYSTAMGQTTTASGPASTAMGYFTTASGQRSTAMGKEVMAGSGTVNTLLGAGYGNYTFALGLLSGNQTTDPMVTGDRSMGIFMGHTGDQSGVDFTASDTLGLFGGTMVIDPRKPAQQMSARGVLDLGAATDALVLPAGPDGDRPAGVAGMIRFNSTSNSFEGYDGSTWGSLASGGGSPAAPSRGIQFNSGGSFAAEANFTYTADGDLIVGSSQIEDTGTGSEDSRMFFDVSNSAFRAGFANGNQWDYASSGQYSTALGYNTTASGDYGVALGRGAIASGNATTATGYYTTASGMFSTVMGVLAEASGAYSVAIGYEATASGATSLATGGFTTASGGNGTAMGYDTTASGSQSTAMGSRVMAGSGTVNNTIGAGYGNNTFAIGLLSDDQTTNPMITGDRSMGIFMGHTDAQSGVDFTASDTLGLFGGQMVIDPRQPATNLSADTALEVEGTVKIAYGGEACDAAREGAIRFDSGANTFSFCANDASGWESITLGSGTLAALSDTNISVPATGNVLYYSGSEWVNANLAVNDLADVDTTGFADGHVLTYSAGASGWVSAANAGGGTFTGLSDTPSVYTGSAGKYVRVNSGETGLEFTDQIVGSVSGEPAPDFMALDDLSDTTISTPTNGECLTYNGSAWVDGSCGGGSPAAPDRGIQFNSGGSFAADANFTYTADGDLIVGSSQIEDTGTGSEDSRMFFDVSNSAFRAGSVTGNQWNYASSGQYSAAFGRDTEASGIYSFAAGYRAIANKSSSTAFGAYTTASGTNSTAMGMFTTASGQYGTAMGYGIEAQGNHTVGIQLNNDAAGTHVITQTNTMAIMGGNVGIGTVAPNVELDVVGDIEYTGTITDVSDRRLKTDIKALNEFYGSGNDGNLSLPSLHGESVQSMDHTHKACDDEEKGSRHCERSEAVYGSDGSGLLRRVFVPEAAELHGHTGSRGFAASSQTSAPRNDEEKRQTRNDGVSATPLLDRLAAVDTYSFRMKDDPDGEIELGVMAQDVKKTFPELVKTAEDQMGTMSVNYVGFIAPLIEASKELHAQNQTLQAENAALRTEIASIQNTQDDILQEIKGIKAHTGYGINKAEIGLWLLAGMGGGMMIMFLMGGALRHRSRQDG